MFNQLFSNSVVKCVYLSVDIFIPNFINEISVSLGPAGGCGGEINVDSSYELTAPLNPKTGQYYNFLRCGWTLKAPTGKILEIQLKELELEEPDAETERCYDYIAV